MYDDRLAPASDWSLRAQLDGKERRVNANTLPIAKRVRVGAAIVSKNCSSLATLVEVRSSAHPNLIPKTHLTRQAQ